MGIDSFEKFPNMKSGSKTLDEDFLEKTHDKALELMDDEKYEEAFEEFEKIVDFEISPDGAEDFVDWWEDALYHEFDILSELGKNEEALELIDILLGSDPNDTDYLLGKGYVLDALNRHKEALTCYKKMLEVDSKADDALVNMSSSLIDMNEFKDSLKYSEEAIKIDSKNEDAWYNKGEALLNLGEYKKALDCIEKSIEIDRTDGEAWRMKAQCMMILGKDEDEILDALLVACSLEPEIKIELKESLIFDALNVNNRFKKIIK